MIPKEENQRPRACGAVSYEQSQLNSVQNSDSLLFGAMYEHGTGPFDVLRWYRTAGWNSRLAGRKRTSPIVQKTSFEHGWWMFGYDEADKMLASEDQTQVSKVQEVVQ